LSTSQNMRIFGYRLLA